VNDFVGELLVEAKLEGGLEVVDEVEGLHLNNIFHFREDEHLQGIWGSTPHNLMYCASA